MNSYDAYELIEKDVFLWIYRSENGILNKYSNVDIYNLLSPFFRKPTNKFCAINNKDRLDRIVSDSEYEVKPYNGFKEYLVWSKVDDENRIKALIFDSIIQKAKQEVTKSIDNIILRYHNVLNIAKDNLSCELEIANVTREDVINDVNKYFNIFNEGE